MLQSRRFRLLMVGFLCVGALMISFLVQEPIVPKTVDEIMENPLSHTGEVISLRGVVSNGSINLNESVFYLEGENAALEIEYGGVMVSDAFSEGKTIQVKGKLFQIQEKWTLQAEEIIVGCPSKYDVDE